MAVHLLLPVLLLLLLAGLGRCSPGFGPGSLAPSGGAFGRRLPVRPGGPFEGARGAAARGLHQGAFTDQAPHRLHRGRAAAAAAALGLPPVLFTGSLSFLPPLPASC